MIPSDNEIKALHEKYTPTPEAFELVYTHCKIVAEIATDLLLVKPQPGIDKAFVQAGCLLHDIGVYRLWKAGGLDMANYITHGVEGYDILESEGYDEALCRIASHHTGVGLSKEEIERKDLPLPHQDFFAETQAERLVMYADKFHSKHPQFNTYESYMKKTASFGDHNVQTFERLAEEFGKPALEALAAKYGHPLV